MATFGKLLFRSQKALLKPTSTLTRKSVSTNSVFVSKNTNKQQISNLFGSFNGANQKRSIHMGKSLFSGGYAGHHETPNNTESTPFEFNEENLGKIKEIIAKYPKGYQQGALMPLLDLAQRQHGGWVPLAAMNKIAKILEIQPMAVYEVASFYTMYNRQPIGKYHVQVCTTTPCMLNGAYEILETCKKNLGIDVGETTPDNLVTLGEVECAGCCVNAPMLSIGDDYYEDLTPETANKILNALKKGEKLPPRGPQNGRKNCEPNGGKTTLIEAPTTNFRDIETAVNASNAPKPPPKT